MRTVLVVVSSLLVGCGDDGAPPMIIGGADAAPDSPPAPCLAQMTYGTPTPADEIATRDADTSPTEIYYDSVLDANPKFDDLSIQLFKGYGAYETGEIVPGIVALNGVEANFETCGACVLIYVDIDPANDYADEGTYMVDGGTLNLMSVSPNIKGRIANANFVHVTIDPDTGASTPVGDCSSHIDAFEFDFPVTTDTGMMVAGSGAQRQRHRRR